ALLVPIPCGLRGRLRLCPRERRHQQDGQTDLPHRVSQKQSNHLLGSPRVSRHGGISPSGSPDPRAALPFLVSCPFVRPPFPVVGDVVEVVVAFNFTSSTFCCELS